MADEAAEADKPEEGAEAPEKKSRGPVKLLGGIVGVIALGGMLAVMAIPSKEKVHELSGPYLMALVADPIPVNTTDSNHTRYVKFAAHAEFMAYEESYATARASDPFYRTYLRSRIEEVTSDKQIVSVMKGMSRQVFAEELRHALAPIVFPVHVGATKRPLDTDAKTGLRPGLSHVGATFRGYFHEHVLRMDGPSMTLQVDDGPTVTYNGDEEDLRVETGSGDYVYLDVTQVEPEFIGEIPIGVHGRLRKVIVSETIAQ